MANLLSFSCQPKALSQLPPSFPFSLHKPSTPKSFNPCNLTLRIASTSRCRLLHHVSKSSVKEEQSTEEDPSSKSEGKLGLSEEDGGNWTTSILLLGLWGVLMYYVFNLAPNQTPIRDAYFLKKLVGLRIGDGFRMNAVLVALWYVMGLWPVVYSMLLIPSGRSSKSKVPVWPFVVLSFFGGAYALLPYFVLWRPPPPAVDEAKLSSWPLNFLESKIAAGVLFAAGLGLFAYALMAGGADWKEFYQYFRESKFIHVMGLDFVLLSTFSAFWVYNDMSVRKWYEQGSWWVYLALIPFIGPSLYIIVRPSLPLKSTSQLSKKS